MPDEPTYEDLMRQIQRDRTVKEVLANRLVLAQVENAELMAVVQELQARTPTANGDQPATAEAVPS